MASPLFLSGVRCVQNFDRFIKRDPARTSRRKLPKASGRQVEACATHDLRMRPATFAELSTWNKCWSDGECRRRGRAADDCAQFLSVRCQRSRDCNRRLGGQVAQHCRV
jgi:hypothetical protein